VHVEHHRVRRVGLLFNGGAHTLLLVINNLTEEAARARLA